MKHSLNLFIILIVSISLSLFAWFVDSGPKTNGITLNIFEIFMVSLIFLFSLLYYILLLIF